MKTEPKNITRGTQGSIAKTIVAGYYKFGAATFLSWEGRPGHISWNTMKKEKIYYVIGNNQPNSFRGDGKIINCLPAAMGMGGGYIPYLFSHIIDDDNERRQTTVE